MNPESDASAERYVKLFAENDVAADVQSIAAGRPNSVRERSSPYGETTNTP